MTGLSIFSKTLEMILYKQPTTLISLKSSTLVGFEQMRFKVGTLQKQRNIEQMRF